MARPVGLGVDPNIKAKCFANKFATLLPKSPFDADEKFKWIEKDGQQLFVKSFEAGQKRNFTTWLQAFHVFVAIYCWNHPSEDLPPDNSRKSRGRRSARLWLEMLTLASIRSRHAPMEPKEQRTFSGRSSKGHRQQTKNRKQPFCSSQQKPKYGFSFNNKGKGNSCTYPRICQYCSGKHSRLLCRQKQPWPNRAPPHHVSIKNIYHYTTI